MATSTSMRRVIKIGGSLLVRPHFHEHFHDWLVGQSKATNLIIVGGGKAIDAVRELDQIHQFAAADIHWLCVDQLATTHRLVSLWFPDWPTASTPEKLSGHLDGTQDSLAVLVGVSAFYRPECDGGLPHDWRTTTDSIAAWLARVSAADELVLLKSCKIPSPSSFGTLADLGILDAAFPGIEPEIVDCRIRIEEFG